MTKHLSLKGNTFKTWPSFQLGIDEDNVKRLSGEFAVSIVDIGPTAKDLKVANSQLELHVLYGPRPAINRYR